MRLRLYERFGATLFGLALAVLFVASSPSTAHAQYKNTSFTLDAGAWLSTKPSVVDGSGQVFSNTDRRPIRLSPGVRIGGDSAFRLAEDRWWFVARLNLGFFDYGDGGGNTAEQLYHSQAQDALGTIMGIQGSIGIRFMLLTDDIRPYIQTGLSYLRLFTFGSGDQDTFLTHANVGGIHLEPGIEFILKRDIALRIFGDFQRWLVVNTTDNHSVVVGAGIVFFT